MSRTIALGIVTVAALVALGLVIQLWRSRRASPGPWSRQDSLAALGLLIATLGIVIPLLVSDGEGAGEENPEVHAYRQDVRSACASLGSMADPFMGAVSEQGFNRTKLVDGYRNQIRAMRGVLDGLWEEQPPDKLDAEAKAAEAAGRRYLTGLRHEIDRMERQLPPQLSIQEFAAFSSRVQADLQPSKSALNAAMSRLADQQCLGSSQSPSS